MFKGVALYSWQDNSSKGWRFALLPGTNRAKFSDEVRNHEHSFDPVQTLKNTLSQLAPGEYVTWQHLDTTHIPADIVHDIHNHAKVLGIRLTVSWEDSGTHP